MTRMFDNYKNANYCPNNEKDYPLVNDNEIYRKPIEEYDSEGNLIGYSWTYEDSIVLEFNTDGYVINENGLQFTAQQYLVGKKLRLNIYDFRHNIVFTETKDAYTLVRYLIDTEVSKLLVPDVYTCSLTLLDDTNKVVTTLFSEDSKVRLYVK